MDARDPRLRLARGDRAEAALEGRDPATHFAELETLQAVAPVASLRAAPDPAAEQQDQLLFGERFEVLENEGAFAFGRAVRDGYVGWVARAALGAPSTPTHRVHSLRAFAYASPDIKAPANGPYSLNALVSVDLGQGRFLHAAGAGWFAESDLAPIGQAFETDPAAVALRFLGTAYLWGGRDSLGLDCSGLVQQALYACGRACPRDSDQQEGLGRPLTDIAELGRNDLVFWPTHVGLMLDGERLLNANTHAMAVVVEPLSDVIARMAAAGEGPPRTLRRL